MKKHDVLDSLNVFITVNLAV